MKAIELTAFEGFNGLKLLEVEKPKPSANEAMSKRCTIPISPATCLQGTTIPEQLLPVLFPAEIYWKHKPGS